MTTKTSKLKNESPVLVTGCEGQLGRAFSAELTQQNIDFIAMSRSEIDIANGIQVAKVFEKYRPRIVINAAAFTDVERAEEDRATAVAVNQGGVTNLRDACQKYDCMLVHFSSDYVFDGENRKAYIETDATNPISAYGKSKLLGDQELLDSSFKDFLIFRSSWVFGHGNQNFFVKLLKWAESNDVLEVVYDQLSSPSYAVDIARVSLTCIERNLRGLFNLSNSGYASRYEVARELFRQLKIEKMVIPVPSSKFTSVVQRPFFSQLSTQKLEHAAKINVPSWQDALQRYLLAEGLIQ